MTIMTTETVQWRPDQYPAPLQKFLEHNWKECSFFEQRRPLFFSWLEAHLYVPVAVLCVDGRVSDFSTNALGLMQGITHVFRARGLISCTLRNATYARWLQKTFKRIQETSIHEIVQKRIPLFFVVAHYSASNAEQGCLACKQENPVMTTEVALSNMRRTAQAIRDYIGNKGVILECLLDTDRDTIKIFGPGGSIDNADYINDMRDNQALHEHLKDRITQSFMMRRIDIPNWTAFIEELAEHLTNNLLYARSTFDRPIEHLDHREKLILIGGPLETRNRNAAFLIGRGDSYDMLEDLELGLQVVGRNILRHASRTGSDPRIPILVSLDYDNSQDKHLISQVTLGIVDTLQKRLKHAGEMLADAFSHEGWWHNAPNTFKRAVIEHHGHAFWAAAVYEQTIRRLQIVK